jgi:hypothetical protein
MARLSWIETSEIIFGKLLESAVDPQAINAALLISPYREGLQFIKKSGTVDHVRVAEVVGLDAMGAAVQAAQTYKGLPLDWYTLLRKAASRHDAGIVFTRLGQLLERGESVDISPAIRAIRQMEENQGRLVSLADVKPEERLWKLSHFEALDYHLGGVPRAYPTVIGASPGVGKTTLLIELAVGVAKSGGRVAIFTLEMTNGHLLTRMLDVDKRLTKKTRCNISVCQDIMPIDDIIAVASRAAMDKPFDMIGIDFADLIIEGDESEQKMAAVYRGVTRLSKNLETPVVLIAQLSRRYRGGIPRLSDLRYSGMAEALCGLVLFIHNPKNIFTDEINERDNQVLPAQKGRGYLVVAKSKCGYGIHDSPGAINIGWEGLRGWKREKGEWFDLSGF